MLGTEPEEEGEGFVAWALDEVELMDGVDAAVTLEELGASGPEDGDVDARGGELEPEFVEDGGRLKRVPDAGEADDEDALRVEGSTHDYRRLQWPAPPAAPARPMGMIRTSSGAGRLGDEWKVRLRRPGGRTSKDHARPRRTCRANWRTGSWLRTSQEA